VGPATAIPRKRRDTACRNDALAGMEQCIGAQRPAPCIVPMLETNGCQARARLHVLLEQIMCPFELQARIRQVAPSAMFGARLVLHGKQAQVQLELRCDRLTLHSSLRLSAAPQAEHRSSEQLRSEWAALVAKAFCERGRGAQWRGAC
jgi:hypothetical protein